MAFADITISKDKLLYCYRRYQIQYASTLAASFEANRRRRKRGGKGKRTGIGTEK